MWIAAGSHRTWHGWPVVDCWRKNKHRENDASPNLIVSCTCFLVSFLLQDLANSRERAVAGQADAGQIWTGHLLPIEDDRSRPY